MKRRCLVVDQLPLSLYTSSQAMWAIAELHLLRRSTSARHFKILDRLVLSVAVMIAPLPLIHSSKRVMPGRLS
jgi:hypothetical protein